MLYGWYYRDPGDPAFSDDEKTWNAGKAMTILRQHGFTIYAAAGVVGNAWAEASVNPGQWQGDTAFSGGYGIMQWTPYTLYSEWAGADWERNGPKQCQRILYERENGLEFYPSTSFPGWNWARYCAMTPDYEQGETDIDCVNKAAEIWTYNYLRPADPASTLANRKYHARYVYQHAPGFIYPPWLLLWWNNKNLGVIP